MNLEHVIVFIHDFRGLILKLLPAPMVANDAYGGQRRIATLLEKKAVKGS